MAAAASAAFIALPPALGNSPTGWDALPDILAKITPPSFPDRDFPITEYGAEAGAAADARPAIEKAIAACAEAGGGRVVVPAGEWRVDGPINLRSGVNLHLEEDAVVKFSPEPADYLPPVLTRFEGAEVMNYSPPIYVHGQKNVAITGRGVFDGQADADHWWNWKRTADEDVSSLGEMVAQGVPANERVFGGDHRLRTNFVQFYRCQNVLIEGVTFINAPMWVVHPVLCENVTVRGITVRSHGPNNDGCNPESCRNVLIEGCTFDTGDDCIAIKSGRNEDGRRLAAPSENIVVRTCTMKDGHGGVTLGSEMSGGVRNVFVEDCYMSSPELERAIRLKSNSKRGGYLENMFVRRVRVGEVREAVLHIDLRYADETGQHDPTVRNIVLEDVSSEKSERPLFLLGIESSPMQNILIKRCTFKNAERPSLIEYVDRLEFRDVRQPE